MTKDDISKYWPTASPNQKIVIGVYHDAGYTIETGLDESSRIEMSRATSMDTVDHFFIWPTGRVTPDEP